MKTKMGEKKLVRINTAVRQLGVSASTIRNWARKGVLKAVQLFPGAHRRFDLEDIKRLKKQLAIR